MGLVLTLHNTILTVENVGRFGHGRFGQDVLATDVLATYSEKMDVLAKIILYVLFM